MLMPQCFCCCSVICWPLRPTDNAHIQLRQKTKGAIGSARANHMPKTGSSGVNRDNRHDSHERSDG